MLGVPFTASEFSVCFSPLTLPELSNFRHSHLLKLKKKLKQDFKKRTEFFLLLERKRSEKKVAEEYFWAITQSAGWSCCGRLGSSALRIRVSATHCYRLTCLAIQICNSDWRELRLVLDRQEPNCCVSQRESLRHRYIGEVP